jgi:pimeloyl-ACP methyl ester carboxylesterase
LRGFSFADSFLLEDSAFCLSSSEQFMSLSFSAPSLTLLGAEPLRATLEYVGMHLRPMKRVAAGDGHPVVVFPGLASDGSAVAPLKRFCRSLGHPSFDWGRGFNTGPRGELGTWIDELSNDVERLIEGHGERATLIGWSLGGIYAREVARHRPHLARQVITIGTPFAGRAKQTRAGLLYRVLNGQPAKLDEDWHARLQSCPPVPTTSIFSRSDGVVAWQACQQAQGRGRFENVEVRGSHLGLGWNAQVFDVIGDRLRQIEGTWQPYAAVATPAIASTATAGSA